VSLNLKVLLVAVVSTATFLFSATLFTFPLQSGIGGVPGLLFWIATTLVASAFPVHTPRGPVVSVAIAPILAAAALGGPTAAVLTALFGTIEWREVRLRVPWYGTLYNHAADVIPAVLSASVYGLVSIWRPPLGIDALWAVVLAGATYFLTNAVLLSIAIALRERRSSFAVFVGYVRAFGLALFGLAPLAWLMVVAYELVGPMMALLFALPLYTTRSAYARVVEIRGMFTQTVTALATAIDARDPKTKQHSTHVSTIAIDIGRELGCGEEQLEQLEWGGLLHDIGKIGIPDDILLKPDRLNREERIVMNQHPVLGEEILRPVDKLAAELPLIRHHHEWYNGSGYPDRLVGEQIPFLARILHVADAYEAMTAIRPYRLTPLDHEQALGELRKYAGIQFDPRVVEAFARTEWATGSRGRPAPVEVAAPPIPVLGQVAALRARGAVAGLLPADAG
jgi:putative nucleotidyltransferase with HDIG domain